MVCQFGCHDISKKGGSALILQNFYEMLTDKSIEGLRDGIRVRARKEITAHFRERESSRD